MKKFFLVTLKWKPEIYPVRSWDCLVCVDTPHEFHRKITDNVAYEIWEKRFPSEKFVGKYTEYISEDISEEEYNKGILEKIIYEPRVMSGGI